MKSSFIGPLIQVTVLYFIPIQPRCKEVLHKEKGRRLCYIYGLCTSMELNPPPVAPLVLKFGIHLRQAGRKGMRGGEEEGTSGRVESQCS
jgi:hypothetical protein